jgi:3-oxoacyl-[acyl-carrier-protein] synthase II
MIAYIRGAAVLSPQKTFTKPGFPDEIIHYPDSAFLKCLEPNYRDYIDPMVARRMSRVVKMGVCAALQCMKDTGIDMPDGIIAGTGLGCLEDTGKFLVSIYANEEKLLNPTPFIQSTHNTVAGAIALAIKCHHYNATYTHRGFSFENALQDALMQLSDNPSLHILAGGFDELTDHSYTLTKRLGLWKNHAVDNFSLYDDHSRGSLPGEGVAFFMLGGQKGTHDFARLVSMKTLFEPDVKDNGTNITRFLREAGTGIEQVDLVILGNSGDDKYDRIYDPLTEGVLANKPCAAYKYLCGEYDTSASFALYMASLILKYQKLPEHSLIRGKCPEHINRILLYNHLRAKNHSLYLLERC